MAKFTFKTEKSTGRYRSFYTDSHYIKLKRKQVGIILEKRRDLFKIQFMVWKSEEDKKKQNNNPNCDWKWITLKKEFLSLKEAKEFLVKNTDGIIKHYNLRENEV